MTPLVSCRWLADQLGAPDLRIVDASWFLPEHGRDPRAEFVAGHIPGAVFLDLDSLADRVSPLPSMLAPAAAVAARLGALGIGERDRIVCYDASPLHTSARAWWAMRTAGAHRVAILDGGLAAWRAEGFPVEGGEGASPEPANFDVNFQPQNVAVVADVHRSQVQVVDARSPSRFAGEEPEPRPGVRPGHIPGSRNIPYRDLFETDGRWRSPSALRGIFADLGPDPIIATCGSGITAATLVFALHLLGRDASLYDGSWAEWGSDANTPMVPA